MRFDPISCEQRCECKRRGQAESMHVTARDAILNTCLGKEAIYSYVTVKKHFTKKCNNHSCRDALPQKQREQAITPTATGSQTTYTMHYRAASYK